MTSAAATILIVDDDAPNREPDLILLDIRWRGI